MVSGLRLRIYASSAWMSGPLSASPNAGIFPGEPVAMRHEDEIVVALRAHQLRALPGLAAAALMAPAAAIADEQRLAMRDLRCRIGGLDPVSAARPADIPPAQPHHTAATSIAPPATIHCFIISILLAACRFFWHVNCVAFGFEAVMLASRTGRGRLRFRPWQPEASREPPTCTGRRRKGAAANRGPPFQA